MYGALGDMLQDQHVQFDAFYAQHVAPGAGVGEDQVAPLPGLPSLLDEVDQLLAPVVNLTETVRALSDREAVSMNRGSDPEEGSDDDVHEVSSEGVPVPPGPLPAVVAIDHAIAQVIEDIEDDDSLSSGDGGAGGGDEEVQRRVLPSAGRV